MGIVDQNDGLSYEYFSTAVVEGDEAKKIIDNWDDERLIDFLRDRHEYYYYCNGSMRNNNLRELFGYQHENGLRFIERRQEVVTVAVVAES